MHSADDVIYRISFVRLVRSLRMQKLSPDFQRPEEEETIVNHFVASVDYAEHEDNGHGFRAIRELIQNWHDVIFGEKKDDVDARAAAGKPVLKIIFDQDWTVYRYCGENDENYIYGDLWYIRANITINGIKGPALLTHIPHKTSLRINHLWQLTSSTKTRKAVDSAMAGKFGEGAKIAAVDAMRMNWQLEYTSRNFYVYYVVKEKKKQERQQLGGVGCSPEAETAQPKQHQRY